MARSALPAPLDRVVRESGGGGGGGVGGPESRREEEQTGCGATEAGADQRSGGADVKINLVCPCTASHVAKYSPQLVRVVTETPAVYARHVAPYIARQLHAGRLSWLHNILEGRAEQDHVILRSSRDPGRDRDGFLLLPDMNWDRRNMAALRILGLVERRDLRSLRDLRKRDVGWLREMEGRMVEAVVRRYGEQGGVERDLLKSYVHCEFSCFSLASFIPASRARAEPSFLPLVSTQSPYKLS